MRRKILTQRKIRVRLTLAGVTIGYPKKPHSEAVKRKERKI